MNCIVMHCEWRGDSSRLTRCHGRRSTRVPLQVRELLNWLSLNFLLEHWCTLKPREHRVQRRRKHVAAAGAADHAAGGRQRRCLRVAHAITRLKLLRVEDDSWPVELLRHAHGRGLRCKHLRGCTSEAGLVRWGHRGLGARGAGPREDGCRRKR